jgi:hypothetical protein
MSLEAAIIAIQGLVAEGIIPRYAIAGAVAATFYVEPMTTFDLDILVSIDAFQSQPGSLLLTLEPIRNALAKAGYSEFRDEGIIVAGWPVQFLPAESPLHVEAIEQAIEMPLAVGDSPTSARVLRAEHIVAIALEVGRPKDRIRIAQFIEQGVFDRVLLKQILERHGLLDRWRNFCGQIGVTRKSDVELLL